jgi:hypothetical protein
MKSTKNQITVIKMKKNLFTLFVALQVLVLLFCKPIKAQDYMLISLTVGTEMEIAIADIQKLTFDLAVGMQHHPEVIRQLLKLKLFPNPAKDLFTLEYTLPEKGNVLIEVFTANGTRIKAIEQGYQQNGDHQYQMRSKQLVTGVYLIRVQQNNQFVVERLVVIP